MHRNEKICKKVGKHRGSGGSGLFYILVQFMSTNSNMPGVAKDVDNGYVYNFILLKMCSQYMKIIVHIKF